MDNMGKKKKTKNRDANGEERLKLKEEVFYVNNKHKLAIGIYDGNLNLFIDGGTLMFPLSNTTDYIKNLIGNLNNEEPIAPIGMIPSNESLKEITKKDQYGSMSVEELENVIEELLLKEDYREIAFINNILNDRESK